MRVIAAAAAALIIASCSSNLDPKRPSIAEQRAAAEPVVQALRAAQFEPARTRASAVLKSDPLNARAAAGRALSTYVLALSTFRREAEAVLQSAGRSSGFDHARMRSAFEATLSRLAEVRRDLDIAAEDAGFGLELCLACWERDWNHSGEVDERDRRFLEIELDNAGNEFPEADPRRRPTFRFDLGDVYWAQAMVSYQSAAIELILAYKWTELDKLLGSVFSGGPPTIRIELDSPDRVRRARDLIIAGIDASKKTHDAYLAETDDDREWVPNPTQRSHPLPLPVDAALYQTWAGVLDDLRDLVAGKTGLSVTELAQLGDHQWAKPPGGYIDIGKMLGDPKTIVIDFRSMKARLDDKDDGNQPDPSSVEAVLADVLGGYYAKSMKASPILGRLSRMKSELERGEDSFGRKLRYLFWLN